MRRGRQQSAAACPWPAPLPGAAAGHALGGTTQWRGKGRRAHALLTGLPLQAAGKAAVGSGDGTGDETGDETGQSSAPSRRWQGPPRAPPRSSAPLLWPRPYVKMAPRARRPRWKSNADSSMISALALRRRFQGEVRLLERRVIDARHYGAGRGQPRPEVGWNGMGRDRTAPLPPSSLASAALRGPEPGVVPGAPSPWAGLLSVLGHRGGPASGAARRAARRAGRALPVAALVWACSTSDLPRGREGCSLGLEGPLKGRCGTCVHLQALGGRDL